MNIYQKSIILVASIMLLIGAILSLIFTFVSVPVFFLFSTLVLIVTLLLILSERVIFYRYEVKKKTEKSYAGDISKEKILYSIRSIFPFQIFPDRYILEEKKLYVVKKLFFGISWTEMYSMKDIAGARLYSGPFFASLTVFFRTSIPEKSIQMRNLWKNQALHMKELIDGLVLKTGDVIEVPEELPIKAKEKILRREGGQSQVKKEIS